MKQTRFLTGFSVVLVFICASAFADQRAEFKQAYEQYQAAMGSGDKAAALEAAADAYRLGTRVYGKDSVNAARLSMNYAGLLNDEGDFKNARKVLKRKLEVIEQESDAEDLGLVLFEMGRAEFDASKPKRGLEYFDRSVQAVPEENVGARASRAFAIGSHLLKQRGDGHTKAYFEVAHTGFKQVLQPTDLRRGLASYHLGLWAYRERRMEDAIAFFDESLVAFTGESGPMTDFERPVRMLLITLHERAGESALATPHVLAFGRGQAWREQPEPLFMDTTPTMMMAKSGVQGDVQLSFGIDETGNVTDLAVASSTNTDLNDLAREVMSTARFAPQFRGDMPVATNNVSYRLTFDFTVPQAIKRAQGIPPTRGFPDEDDFRGGRPEGFIGRRPTAIESK